MKNLEKDQQIDRDETGDPRMTVKTVRTLCISDGILEAPEFVEKLYLYEKGFKKIEPLPGFKNVVSLWLNGNQIGKIQNLEAFGSLVCLYLNNNCIGKIEGLDQLRDLEILNLEKNRIVKVENLDCLTKLKNLNLAENGLKSCDSIKELASLKKLTNLDLSKNQIENDEEVLTIIKSLQSIACLSLRATPFSRGYKNYRKNLIACLTQLKSLDDRPVQESEHRLCEAWLAGGAEMEKKERNRIMAEQKNKKTQQKDDSEHFYKVITPVVSSEVKPVKQTQPKPQKSTVVNEQKQNIQEKPKQNEKEPQVEEEETEIIQPQLQTEQTRKENQNGWLTPYNSLLQALLQKYQFDFSEAQPRLNMIITSINKRLGRTSQRFQIPELQKIWTGLQIARRKK